MEFFNSIIGLVNNLMYNWLLIILLAVAGLYFSFKTGFVQFSLFPESLRIIAGKDGKRKSGISSFQAFSISTASRVGTGNIAGVAIAIAKGGPGAIFWMWVFALIGSATGFIESTLAQIYKVKGENGTFHGGPAHYIEKSLKSRGIAVVFAILTAITFGIAFNQVQANTVSIAFNEQFGVSRGLVGLILAVLTASVIFGGLTRIAKISALVVPVMATLYIALALIVVLLNITQLPAIFMLVIESAFGMDQVIGGALGNTIRQGVKRGMFSNEAGMGSVPNAAATADTSHPVKQGLVQSTGVFLDTLLICTATAFIILFSGIPLDQSLTGIELTQSAVNSQFGVWANWFLCIAIFLFAFSSLIGNYYYGHSNIQYITKKKIWITFYRIFVVGAIVMGSVLELSTVWDTADVFMGVMTIINVIVLFLIGGIAMKALKDYRQQKKDGLEPVFYEDSIPGLETECWKRGRDSL